MRLHSKKIKKKINTVLLVLIIISLVILKIGCGDDDDDDSGNNDPVDTPQTIVLSGRFLDSAVEGLIFETTTQKGVTNANGEFKYAQNETITFSAGGIVLGTAQGGNIITPLNLVPEASEITHPLVTNITRILQTLDYDREPANGILITPEITAKITELVLLTPVDITIELENNSTFLSILTELNNLNLFSEQNHSIVSANDALSHLQATLDDLANPTQPPDDDPTGGQTDPINNDTHVLFTSDKAGGLYHLTSGWNDTLVLCWSNGLNHEIWQITLSGEKTVLATQAQIAVVGGDILSLYMTSADHLYGIIGDNVVEIDTTGKPTVIFSQGATLGFQSAGFLTSDNEGNLYISNLLSAEGKIFKITPEGNGSIYIDKSPDGFSGIGQILFNSNQDLIVLSNDLYKFTTNNQEFTALFPEIGEQIISAYKRAYEQGAHKWVSEDASISGNYFALDKLDGIFTQGTIQIVKDARYDFFSDDSLIKIDSDGQVIWIKTDENYSITSMIYINDSLYYIATGKYGTEAAGQLKVMQYTNAIDRG